VNNGRKELNPNWKEIGKSISEEKVIRLCYKFSAPPEQRPENSQSERGGKKHPGSICIGCKSILSARAAKRTAAQQKHTVSPSQPQEQ
jgi:hypothetical protein